MARSSGVIGVNKDTVYEGEGRKEGGSMGQSGPRGGRVLLAPGKGCWAGAGVSSLPPSGERAEECIL